MSRRKTDKRRHRGYRPHGGDAARQQIPLTADGVPAAVPDAPPVSGVVFVSGESRALYPWLPARVIAWSVWRGPAHVRVQIDEQGNALQLGVRPTIARTG